MAKFNPDKDYSIRVWDMSMVVVDHESGDYIRNENGSVKLFELEHYDYSYLCNGIDVNDLAEMGASDG